MNFQNLDRDSIAIQQSRLAWFANGLVISFLVFAAANAISFFVRSSGWQSLVDPKHTLQAIGFPWKIWQLGETYPGGAMINQSAFWLNACMAILFGLLAGAFLIRSSRLLNRFMQFAIDREKQPTSTWSWQFSIAGILIFMSVVAILFALIRAAFGASPRLLMGIYLLGPASLVVLSMIPKGLTWQARVILLTPSTLIMIGFAVFVGNRIGLSFDNVMLGIFVCWVPQTVITAVLLMMKLAIEFARIDSVA